VVVDKNITKNDGKAAEKALRASFNLKDVKIA
jgi:hypothetical protein